MKPMHILSSLVLLLVAAVAEVNPVPLIYQPLVPVTVKPGSSQFMLTINGSGFASTAVVTWNGSTRTTSFISTTQIQAAISAADVARPGTASVNVVNPAPGGGISNTVFFSIQTPAPSATLVPASGFSGSGVSVEGDFNNDGLPDLALGNQSTSGFFIDTYFGKGNGTFGSPFVNHSVAPVVSMITGNFTNDALIDLAVLDGIGNTTIFANHGSGIFIQRQVFRSTIIFSSGLGLATGDFNQDGKLDLVVSGYSTEIFLGNGDGTFGGGRVLNTQPCGAGGGAPAVGDFNGDGNLDLALPCSINGIGVIVFLGNGDGTFQAPVSYRTTYPGSSAAVADLNGDGKLDIITNGVSVLLGNGDGTFTSAGGVQISGQNSASAPVLGDFNGDSKLDVAVSSSTAIDLLLGNGDGTFQSPTQIATDTATTLVMGDFNSDGKLDFVGSYLYLQIPINLSPASLNFGSQNVGTKSPPQNVTVLNDGASTLPITGISIGGTDPNDFTQTNKCGSSLPIGANCQIAVVFQPQVGGPRAATLKVSYQGLGSPQSVPLSGLGAISTVTLTPAKLTFPIQLVGTTSSAQTATLTNTGTVPVNISNIATTRAFSETNNCPASLPVSGSCQIQVKFAPLQKGLATGTLSVTDDAEGSPQTVALSGTGTIVKLSPLGINFGNQQVGTKSSPAPVQLTNVGTIPIKMHQIGFAGKDPGDFSQTNNCGSSVPAGKSCTIQVTFTPRAKGKRSASLQANDNGGGSPQKVALSGNGA
jgi:hypothetical protein